MPSGGYGLNPEDGEKIREAMETLDRERLTMHYEWFWAYASARGAGASPSEAATAAYIEWDL